MHCKELEILNIIKMFNINLMIYLNPRENGSKKKNYQFVSFYVRPVKT